MEGREREIGKDDDDVHGDGVGEKEDVDLAYWCA